MFKLFGHLGLFSFLNGYLSPMSFAEEVEGGTAVIEKDSEGTPPVKWIDSFPDEAKNDPDFNKYKEPTEVYKAWNERKELIGRKGVIVPTDKSTPEEWDKYYNATGRPEKPEGYKFTHPENLHEGITITPEAVSSFQAKMHKAGVPANQANVLWNDYVGMINDSLVAKDEADTAALEEASANQKQRWGKDYDVNLKRANMVVTKLGGKEAVEQFGDLGSKPAVLEVLSKVGKMMSEDSMNRLGFSSLDTNDAEAKQKINQVRSDQKSAFNDENHPGHQKAVLEMRELYKVAYPEGEK